MKKTRTRRPVHEEQGEVSLVIVDIPLVGLPGDLDLTTSDAAGGGSEAVHCQSGRWRDKC